MDSKDDGLLENIGDDVEIVYYDEEIDFDDEEADYNTDMDYFDTEEGEGSDDDREIEDVSKLTFSKHTSSVFTSDLSKDGQLAVTGGQDDMAYVWSTTNGEALLECTGHKDSIVQVYFNHDNQLIATGDMSGIVQVWSIQEKKLIWCYELDELEWLCWHPFVNVLFGGTNSGEIYVWQVPQGNCKVIPTHGVKCSCGRVCPDGKRLVAGYHDGQIKMWDIKTASVVWQYADPKEISLYSLELNSDGSLIAAVPTAVILKSDEGKQVGQFLLSDDNAIEAAVFNDELNVFITGSLTGNLCIWDISKQTIRHQIKLPNINICLIKLGLNGRIFVGCSNGDVYSYDVRTGALVETMTGHRDPILSLSVSLDNSFVLTTSDSNDVKIFNVKQ